MADESVKREEEQFKRVRATLDVRHREWLSRFLRQVFGHAPSGRVTMNANDGGVLHMELEEKSPRADKN